MGDGAVGRERQGTDAGIAEQVESLGLGAAFQFACHPVPHRGHVGKEAEVPEGGALGGEAHIPARQLPALARDGLLVDPAPAAVLVGAGNEFAVGLPVGQTGRPQRLALRPDEAPGAIAFQLATVAGIDQPIVLPAAAGQDRRVDAKLRHQARGTAWAAT